MAHWSRDGARRASAGGVALILGFLCLGMSPNFVTPGTGIPKAASKSTFANGIDVQRSKEEQTVMYAKPMDMEDVEFPDDGWNQKADEMNVPKEKKMARMNRKPVLAYAVADTKDTGEIAEASGPVLRRMRNMYELNYAAVKEIRKKYFRSKDKGTIYEQNEKGRMIQFAKKNRLKARFDQAWTDWLRKSGRSLRLTESVQYSGPKLAFMLTDELDEKTEPKAVLKQLPTKEEIYAARNLGKGFPALGVPADMMPGNYNEDGEDNVHKVWKRPLHKFPYDIPKFKVRGWSVVRGVVW